MERFLIKYSEQTIATANEREREPPSTSCGSKSNKNTSCGINEDINAAKNKRKAESSNCNIRNKSTKRNEVKSTGSENTTKKVFFSRKAAIAKSNNDETVKTSTPAKESSKTSKTRTDFVQIQNDGETEVKSSKVRRFRTEWLKTFPWLMCPDENYEKVFCSSCTEFVKLELPLPVVEIQRQSQNSKEAFVIHGFKTWSRGNIAFKNHEKSEFHRYASNALASLKQAPVIQQISKAKEQCMVDARKALAKIFETILFLAREGSAFRGSYNKEEHAENSKFTRLLELRANDIPELRSWLHRSQPKWLHHSIVEEILKMMADFVLRKIVSEVKNQKYFAIMLDETSDMSRLEQVCISLRYVTDELVIKEDFLGFYQTKDTSADTLFKIVEDVLLRLALDMSDIRGQCYDGAANVSGHISGLQTRILEVNQTALFVHCLAHRLNLVVQDSLAGITEIRNFLGTVQDMISFVKGSPHRLAEFSDVVKALQQELKDEEEEESSDLDLDVEAEAQPEPEPEPVPQQKHSQKSKKRTPASLLNYCPTRWCVRIKALKRVRDNYASVMKFLGNMLEEPGVDSTITSKADGFLIKMESFSFYFNLITLIAIFELIENLNEALQKHDLNISDSHYSVKMTIQSIEKLRNDKAFDKHWLIVTSGIKELDIEPPSLPRVRKAPKRYESQSSPHIYSSPEELYRKLYFEIIDTTLASLKSRFDSETFNFLTKIEAFILKKDDVDYVKEITSFYKEDNFDAERLTLHRNMLLDIRPFKNITDVIKHLKENVHLKVLLPELFKLVRIFLTVPVSTCTCERCFSALRRLKNYLRTTLVAQRLNNLSVIYIHKDIEIDIDKLLNEFILKNSLRKSTFCVL